jgi:hypothetical protein
MENKYCFFTEVDVLDNQPDTAAFGPVKGSEAIKYRLSSVHTAMSKQLNPKFPNPKAFAVCRGHARFQQNATSPGLVNLILAPTNVDFNGLHVKFIIYRGILKISLENNGELIIPGSYAGDPDGYLIDMHVNNNMSFYHYFKENLLCNANNSLQTLGLAFNANAPDANFVRQDTDSLSSIFFDVTDCNPIEVRPGFYLGDFDKNSFSIEMIVAGTHDEPIMGYARCQNSNHHEFNGNEHILNISGIADINEARYKKEEILCYIDPCSFFTSLMLSGNLYIPAYNLKRFDLNTTDFDSQFPPAIIYTGPGQLTPYSMYGKSAQIIYADFGLLDDDSMSTTSVKILHNRVIGAFNTRNRIYLDIRNENGFSLNFYDEYGGNNTLSYDFNYIRGLNLEAPGYQISEYQTSGWPIIIFQHAPQPGNTLYDMISSIPTTLQKDYFTCCFRLQLSLGEEEASYIQNTTQRFLYASHSGMYFKNNNPQAGRNYEYFNFFPFRNKLFSVVDNQMPTPVKNPVFLSIPLRKRTFQGGSSDFMFFPVYIKLFYSKQNKQTAENLNSINTNHEFDNIVEITSVDKSIKWRPDPAVFKTTYWLTGREKFVQRVDSSSFFIQHYMVETGMAVEKTADPSNGRVVFFMMPVCTIGADIEANYLKQESSKIMNVSKETSFFKAFQNEVSYVTHLKKKLILCNYKQPADFLEYELATGFEPNSPECIISVVMSQKEFDKAIEISQNDPVIKASYHPIMLQAKRINYIDELKTICNIKFFYTGLNSSRKTIIKELKTEDGVNSLIAIGRKNIFATSRALALETGANVIDFFQDFMVYYSSGDPALKEEEKKTFKEALDLIFLYTTERSGNRRMRNLPFVSIYQRIVNYKSNALGRRNVFFHDYHKNYLPQTYTYPTKIIFDSSSVSENHAAGETTGSKFYGKFYENGPDETSSAHLEFRNFKRKKEGASPGDPPIDLFPPKPPEAGFRPQKAENTPPYLGMNLHNFYVYYLLHNKRPAIANDQYTSGLLYSDADKRNNVPQTNKIYFETFNFKTDKTGILAEGLQDKYLRFLTLEEAAVLGYNAVDKVSVNLFRIHFKNYISPGGIFQPVGNKFSYYVYKRVDNYVDWVEQDPTSGVRPEVYKMASTLIHELGHAIGMIENPVEEWVWDKLEEFYFYTREIVTPGEPIHQPLQSPDYINLPAGQLVNTIRNTCEFPTAPNPPFDFPYGGGHLKGSNTGNLSCSVGEDFKEWFKNKFSLPQKDQVQSVMGSPPPQPAPDNTFIYYDINHKYCKFNLV